jgi:hypothetical protein
MTIVDDFDSISTIIKNLEGSAGAVGTTLLSKLTATLAGIMTSVQDVDLSMLDDVTIRGLLENLYEL